MVSIVLEQKDLVNNASYWFNTIRIGRGLDRQERETGENLVKYLEDCSNVLDIGSGRSSYIYEIAQHLPELKIYIMDKDAKILKITKEMIETMHVTDNFEFIRGDATNIPLRNLDAILMLNVMLYLNIKGVYKSLKSIQTALRPGGRFLAANIGEIDSKLRLYEDYKNTKRFIKIKKIIEKCPELKIKVKQGPSGHDSSYRRIWMLKGRKIYK